MLPNIYKVLNMAFSLSSMDFFRVKGLRALYVALRFSFAFTSISLEARIR
jgi:hypothetical protein